MLSCFRDLLKLKTAPKQDKSAPRDHEENRKVQSDFVAQPPASEDSRSIHPGKSVSELSRRSRDLWQEASTKLDDVQKDLLSNIALPQGPSIVQAVADETAKRYHESQNRGLKIPRGEGKSDVNLRAAAGKMLSSVLRFKKLIDAGVAFDPTGYAASAWTIVSMGLQIAQNSIDRLQALFEVSATLTDTLNRCAAIEGNYRDRDLPNSENFEDTIVEVYVIILKFSAQIVSENRMKIARKVLTSINSLSEQPLQELNTKLKSKEEDLRRWTDVIAHQYHKLEMKEIDEKVASALDGIEEVAHGVSSLKSIVLSVEEHAILQWLSDYDFSASHKVAASRRESGTGTWILDNSQYGEWKTSDRSLLWLFGNSGSGKTVLCSQVIDDLEALCARNPSYVLAYWYFTFSIQSSLDIDNLLSSIIRQLCAKAQALPDNIRELGKSNRAPGSRPTRATLMNVLDSLIVSLNTANQVPFVVLDALDEYPISEGHTSSGMQQNSERKDVLLWLQNFCAKHENVHVLILSRDENDIRGFLDKALKVDVAESVIDDLHLFVSNCIERIVEERHWKAQYREAMFSRVEGISEKRFRWASLMQRRFSECMDRERMEQALETLPDSLEAMYADVLMRQIPKDYREKARLMLMWLSYSIRPLRLRELASVASLPEPMDVRRICTSSLVTLSREHIRSSQRHVDTTWSSRRRMPDSEEDVVKFDHFSVKEYMMSERLRASRGDPASYFYVSPLIAHLSIAQLSVSRILDTNGSQFTLDDIKFYQSGELPREKVDIFYQYSDDSTSEQDIDVVEHDIDMASKEKAAMEIWQRFPLLEYSTFWHRHVWEADAIDARLAIEDITKPKLSELKAQAQPRLSQSEELRGKIHSLFSNGLSQSFKNWALLLQHLTDATLAYDFIGVPSSIWYASLLNLPDSVQRLLQSDKTLPGNRDMECFFKRQPEYKQTPLQIAAIEGHLKVLSLLLETDVRVEQPEFAYLVRDVRQHGSAVVGTLIKARPYLLITENMVRSAMWSPMQSEIWRFILESPSLFKLSKAIFVLIVENIGFFGPLAVNIGLVETILRRGEDIGYSQGDFIGASFQVEESGPDSKLVTDRFKKPWTSKKVLALIISNKYCGADMMAVVLENYKGVHFSQDLLALIIANTRRGAEILAMVLKYYQGIHFSKELLIAASNNDWSHGGIIFDLILEYDEKIEVSEDMLNAAAKNSLNGAEIFSSILTHNKTIEVSEATLKPAATNKHSGAKIFSAVLGLDKKFEVSEDILKAAAANTALGKQIISIILSHDQRIEISEDILKVAARNEITGGDIFLVILRHNKHLFISQELMGAIAEKQREGRDIMNVLMDHETCDIELHGGFESLEEMMKNSAKRGYHNYRCEKNITQEMMEAAARWEPEAIAFLTAHKRSNVTFVKSTTQPISDDQTS